MQIQTKQKLVEQTKIKNLISENWQLYVLLLPALVVILIFSYGPMYGVLMAFQKYQTSKGIIGSEWVGFENFVKVFKSESFFKYFFNTLTLSIYSIIAGFPLPIILAMLLNQMDNKHFRKSVQMFTYAPHFISQIVVCGMIIMFLSPQNGVVNVIMQKITGGEPIFYMSSPSMFKHIYVWSGIWQEVGWSSIVYIAALSAIDPSLYESATIDGANKFHKCLYIDIPSLAPTITILLILRCGHILSVGFEKAFALTNLLNIDSATVISTFVYNTGLVNRNYGFSTAVGLFNSVINAILLLMVNKTAKTLGQEGLV